MAIPITKKASSSCMKNMELGSMANVNEALISGAANMAPKFTDVRAAVDESLESLKDSKTKDAPDTNEGNEPAEGVVDGEGSTE